MLRHMAILVMALGAVACCGCGDSPTPAVAVRSSAPPKPAAPPSGQPGEPALKPGAEAPPTQLGGPQIRRMLGSTAAIDPATSAAAAGTSADPSAPTETPAAVTPPTATPPAATDSAAANPNDGSNAVRPPSRRGPRRSDPSGAAPPAADPSAPTNPQPAVDPSAPTSGPLAPKVDPSAPTNGPNVVRAQVGVGAQGKDYGNADGGYISEPVSTYFTARELIIFTIQIPNAMKYFKQFNGRNPKSLDEYMKEIVKANNITLPELPEGSKYVYDAEKGELMVSRPPKK
jgi:hypothetical protein